MLGKTKWETSGIGPHEANGKLNFADCRLVKRENNADVYVNVHMTVGQDANLLKDPRVTTLGADVADLGTGFINGTKARAGGGVVRKDRTYQVGVTSVSNKRDARVDAVALLHQVVAILDPVK